jgi:3-oxoacyl-[acyl-carrier-protein] synthase II
MSRAARRGAVITGVGLVTPLGRGRPGFFEALCEGRSGLVRPPQDRPAELAVDVAGFAPAIDPAEVLPPAEARTVDRFVVMGVAAADEALADAKLVVGRDADPLRTALVVSSGTGGLQTYDQQALARQARGRAAVSPYLLPGMLPNMTTARIAIKHGIRGYSAAIATACAASAHAVADALRLIREGAADVVVCGGSDAPLHPTMVAAFGNARALARGWADPAAASRPFDRQRNGFVLAEGAGVLVLERPEHAAARGAAGYADLVGWAATTDAHHPTMPRPDGAGAADCMRRCLADAGVEARDVGYLNAHGTGTKLGDVAESKAIRDTFGEQAPAVSSTKSVTGHLLGAAGAVEAVVTAIAISRGILPPTHNLDDPDPDCELDHVRKDPRAGQVSLAMSNSFAFGGHNVSLLFERPSTPHARQDKEVPDDRPSGS